MTIVRCQRAFDFCTVMDYKGLLPRSSEVEKQEICSKCIKSSTEIGIGRSNLIHYERIIKQGDSNKLFQDISIESTYEPIIKFKKFDLDICESEYPFFEASSQAFRSALKSGINLINKIQPDLAIVYSPQYAATSGFSKAAEALGVSVIFMEGSSSPYNRYSAVRLWDWKEYGLSNPIATSEVYAQSKIDFRSLFHFRIIRMGAMHSSYSIAKRNIDIRRHYRINSKCKIILAVLSSTDEVFSASAINRINKNRLSTLVFTNQIEWIENTISFVSQLKDTVLIIRIHPREFPNKRETITSKMARIWEEKSREIHNNVIWNLPSENVSLYDLLESANVVVTGWSSVALEALNQRIPVVTYDEDLSGFPKSLTRTGKSRAMYFSNLEVALSERHSWKLKAKVLKYISFRDFEMTFRTGGVSFGSPIVLFFPRFMKVFLAIYGHAPAKVRNYFDKSMNRCRDREKIWLWIKQKMSENKSINEQA